MRDGNGDLDNMGTSYDDDEPLAKNMDDALDRMKRAYERGTGCHLTADMVRALGVSVVGQAWSEERFT